MSDVSQEGVGVSEKHHYDDLRTKSIYDSSLRTNRGWPFRASDIVTSKCKSFLRIRDDIHSHLVTDNSERLFGRVGYLMVAVIRGISGNLFLSQ